MDMDIYDLVKKEVEPHDFIDPTMVVQRGKIGSGFYANIHIGFYRKLNHKVAIKTFANTAIRSEDDIDGLMSEFKAMKRVRHGPNIVRLYGVMIEDTMPRTVSLVMEYMANNSLRHFQKSLNEKKIQLSWILLTDIVNQIISGMCFLHSQRIIHRDLKLDNVLVGRKLEIKIADFGLSVTKTYYLNETSQDTSGTLVYIAPEMLMGTEFLPNEKQDVYSFALMVWELCSDDRAHKAVMNKQHMEITVGHLKYRPPLEPLVEKKCPKELVGIMTRCWAHDPKERPQFQDIGRDMLRFDNQNFMETVEKERHAVTIKLMEYAKNREEDDFADLYDEINKISTVDVDEYGFEPYEDIVPKPTALGISPSQMDKVGPGKHHATGSMKEESSDSDTSVYEEPLYSFCSYPVQETTSTEVDGQKKDSMYMVPPPLPLSAPICKSQPPPPPPQRPIPVPRKENILSTPIGEPTKAPVPPQLKTQPPPEKALPPPPIPIYFDLTPTSHLEKNVDEGERLGDMYDRSRPTENRGSTDTSSSARPAAAAVVAEEDISIKTILDYALSFGKEEPRGMSLKDPFGIAVHSVHGYLVCDKGNARVLGHDAYGRHLKSYHPKKGVRLRPFKPRDVAAAADFFVASDSAGNCLYIFTYDGDVLRQFGDKSLKYPWGVAITSENRIAVLYNQSCLLVVYTSHGQLVHTIGRQGRGRVQFQDPTYIATTNTNNYIVSDQGNSRIQIISPSGEFLTEISGVSPAGVAAIGSNVLVYADDKKKTIMLCKYAGSLEFVEIKKKEDGLESPAGITITHDRRLAVVDNTGVVNVYMMTEGCQYATYRVDLEKESHIYESIDDFMQ